MASVIKIKRSATQSSVPTAGSLEAGELAVNLFDRKLYVGNTEGGVTAISGELYYVTTQDATSGEGVYIKVNGETSSNSVLLQPGTDIDVVRQANGTITISLESEIGSDTTGNAATATKLATARSIALGGDLSGSANFDGSADITITATVADDSHNHVISNVDGLQDALDAKQAAATALTTSTTFGGDVSGTYDNIVIADDSHNHVISNVDGLQDALDAKLALTGGTMTGFITLHADPTQALHATTKGYVDNVSAGIVAAPQVAAATTENLTGTYDNGTSGVGATFTIAATATLTIDDVDFDTLYQGLLIKDQTTAAHNGRYFLSQVGDAGTAWIFTRCTYCDEADEIPGKFIFVTGGTENGQTGWVQHVDDPATFTVGTDDIDLFQFSGAGTYTAGTGLTLTGTEFSLNSTIASDTTGNAATATKLATARQISLTGDATGQVDFDGSQNVSITVQVEDDSHSHVISNVDGLQDAIDGINTNLGQRLGATSTVALTGDVTASATAFSANAVSVSTTLATTPGSTLANYMQVANTNALIDGVNTNLQQRLGATASVTLTGDVTGTASFSANAVTITTTYNNDVVLGTDTSGNYVAGISGTANEIEVSGSGSEGATVTIGLPDDVTIGQDLTVSRNLHVDGNLTVEGAVTYLSTSTVNVDDSMLKLSANNQADSVDTGVYALYIEAATSKYAGYFRDATDGVYKFYTGLQTEPTTTVDTGATGYTLAQVDAVIDGGTY